LGLVLEVNVLYFRNQTFDDVDTLLEEVERTEHAAVMLHGVTDLVTHVLRLLTRSAGFETVDAIQREVNCRLRDVLMLVLVLGLHVENVIGAGATKHGWVEQGVRAQAMCAVNRRCGPASNMRKRTDEARFASLVRENVTTVVAGRAVLLIVNGGHIGERV